MISMISMYVMHCKGRGLQSLLGHEAHLQLALPGVKRAEVLASSHDDIHILYIYCTHIYIYIYMYMIYKENIHII